MASMSGIESFDESELDVPTNNQSSSKASQETNDKQQKRKKKTKQSGTKDEKIIQMLQSMEERMDQKLTEMREQMNQQSAKPARASLNPKFLPVRDIIHDSFASGVEQGMSWNYAEGKKYTSQENMELTKYIRTSVIGQTSDVPQTEIANLTKRYFRSKREEFHRDNDKHRLASKMYQRRFQKARRRKRAIEQMEKFSEKKKEKAQAVMITAYMSSEDEEDGVMIRRPLSWESAKLRKMKKKLDKQYTISANAKSKVQLRERITGQESARPAPKVPDNLSWILQ